MLNKLGNWLRNILPLGNSPKMMIVLAAFVALMIACIGFAKRAHGEDFTAAPTLHPYVQLSGGRTMLRGDASALNLAWTWRAPQSRADMWMTSMTLIGNSSFRGQAYRNNYAFSVQYVTGFDRFDIGIGPSWMINPAPYNGTPVNFNLMLGYRFARIPVTVWWDHFSCGGACSPNEGRDILFAGYRFGGRERRSRSFSTIEELQ